MAALDSNQVPRNQPRLFTRDSADSQMTSHSVDKIPELPFHSVTLNTTNESPQSDQTTVAGLGTQPGPGVDSHAGQPILRAMLLLFGILSITQFAVAMVFFVSPREFSIALQNQHKSIGLTLLPTIANVTTKTTDGWLAAAVGLVGLWAWERHLAKKGTSLDDMEAWGALLSGDIPFSVMNVAKIGVIPVGVFLGVFGLMTAATAAFTNALTPSPGKVTIDREFNVPSLFASDPQGAGLSCARNGGSSCLQASQRGFVLDSINSVFQETDEVPFLGVTVNTSALGIANPGVLATYIEQSTVRDPKFSSDAAFVQAIMCMEGITTNPDCSTTSITPATLAIQAPTNLATNESAIWNLNYENACGEQVTSFPLSDNPDGSMDVSACVDSQGQAHLDWVFFGLYAGNTTNTQDSIQIQCAINIEQASMQMNLSRDEGTILITPTLTQEPCPLTLNPRNIVANLTSQVSALLAVIADPDGGLLSIRAGPDDVDAATYLAALSGMLFGSVMTLDNFFGITFKDDSDTNIDLLNYGGGGVPGYLVPSHEKYTVILLGDGSKVWLFPLALAIVVILASFSTFFKRMVGFDPSDAGSVAAVAFNSDVKLAGGGEGGLATDEEAERRMWFGEKAGEAGRVALRVDRGAGEQDGVLVEKPVLVRVE